MKILLMLKDIAKRYISEILTTFVAVIIPFGAYITSLTVITSESIEMSQFFRVAMDTNKLFGTSFIWFTIVLSSAIFRQGLRTIYYPLFIGIVLFTSDLTTPYNVFLILVSISVVSSIFYQLFEIIYEKLKEKLQIEDEELDIEIKEYVLNDIGDTLKIKIENYDVIIDVEKEV